MQSLRVTLYEIFGYIIPGLLALLGISVLIWAFWVPSLVLPLQIPRYEVGHYIAIGFFSYMLGHVVQAVGNFLKRAELRTNLNDRCGHLIDCAKQMIVKKYGNNCEIDCLSDITALAHAELTQNGKADEYEVFVYREGFYRGVLVSSALFGIALAIRALHPTHVFVNGSECTVSVFSLLLGGALSLFVTALFFRRFLRFGEYRIRYALSALSVLLAKESASDHEDK